MIPWETNTLDNKFLVNVDSFHCLSDWAITCFIVCGCKDNQTELNFNWTGKFTQLFDLVINF